MKILLTSLTFSTLSYSLRRFWLTQELVLPWPRVSSTLFASRWKVFMLLERITSSERLFQSQQRSSGACSQQRPFLSVCPYETLQRSHPVVPSEGPQAPTCPWSSRRGQLGRRIVPTLWDLLLLPAVNSPSSWYQLVEMGREGAPRPPLPTSTSWNSMFSYLLW